MCSEFLLKFRIGFKMEILVQLSVHITENDQTRPFFKQSYGSYGNLRFTETKDFIKMTAKARDDKLLNVFQ